MIDIFYYENGLKKADVKELGSLVTKQLWIDITEIKKEEAELLREAFNLHPLTAEDLVNQNTRIKVEDFTNYLFCVFYGIKKEKKISLVELDFILGKNFVITNHQKEVESYTSFKQNTEKVESLMKKGPDFIFHRLLDIEVDNFFPVLEGIDDEIEAIEDAVTKKVEPALMKKILNIKRTVVNIKKSALPQREKISFLAKNEHPFISRKATPYFRDIYDHSIRVSDSIDNYREGIGNTFDAYMSAVSNNMNEVMKVLSIIATIALPLSVISGIYGTNFAILPGSSFAYSFWAMIAAMVLLMSGMLYFFKRRGWF